MSVREGGPIYVMESQPYESLSLPGHMSGLKVVALLAVTFLVVLRIFVRRKKDMNSPTCQNRRNSTSYSGAKKNGSDGGVNWMCLCNLAGRQHLAA